jgi:hypothetical protein
VSDQTVLKAGSFRVKDYRRNIPVWVKLQSLWRAVAKGLLPDPREVEINCRDLEFDHDPALAHRDYDLAAHDFMPAQNDPDYIEARIGNDHDYKTFGRKPDADKTVTTRGSDIGESTHVRHVRDTETLHDAKLALKRGDPAEVAEILGCVRQKTRLGHKRKIPSHPFSKEHRPFRSGRRA